MSDGTVDAWDDSESDLRRREQEPSRFGSDVMAKAESYLAAIERRAARSRTGPRESPEVNFESDSKGPLAQERGGDGGVMSSRFARGAPQRFRLALFGTEKGLPRYITHSVQGTGEMTKQRRCVKSFWRSVVCWR
jgi:hypothetical protein